MHDEVSHFGVVDGTLRLRFPGRIGAGVVRIDSDDFEPAEVAKLHARYAFLLTTEDEMEQLLCWLLRDVRHETRSAQDRNYEDARRSSPSSSANAANLSRPAAISVPCRNTGRL